MKEILGVYNKKETFTVEELVERYFPEGEMISGEDLKELRITAFNIFCKKREETGNSVDPKENWDEALKVCAIKKYLNERNSNPLP